MNYPIEFVNKYNTNIEDLEAIFETSLALKSVYESALSNLIERTDIDRLQKQKIQNKVSMLNNIQDDSVAVAESGAWARLYPQALIIIISISEQILKDSF